MYSTVYTCLNVALKKKKTKDEFCEEEFLNLELGEHINLFDNLEKSNCYGF